MTETTADPDGRPQGLPAPASYDPARGAAPIAHRDGTVVLILVGDVDRRWAAEATVGLCGAWARGGRRVVLADLHLEDPILHEVTGNDELQGVVDVFLYGASVGRSARPVAGQDFFLIAAGTYEADADAIYRHPRWRKLVAGFRDANASLVLFAPAGKADVEAIAEWVDRLILLGDPGAVPGLSALAARGVEPEALLVPPRPMGAPAERAATPPPGNLVEHHEKELLLPPEPRRSEPPAARHLPTLLVVLLAAAVFAIGGFLLARARPDLVPWAATAVEPLAQQPAEEPRAEDVRGGPSRTGAPLPYSVTGWAFMTLDAAQAHAAEERAGFTSAPFFVSPEEIQGILYYKVLAGAVVDTAAASRLRAELVETGTVEPTESIIQFAPLAFDLGVAETEAAARIRVDSLAMDDVPAYAIPISYSDGSRRWQLYGGAYRDSVSAEAMRRQLAAAGVRSRLIARIGAAGAR